MQVVVKKPPIKFSINTDKEVPTTFLKKIADLIQNEYKSDVNIIYDKDEELVDITESEWFKEMEKKSKPGTTVKIYRQNLKLTQKELGEKLGGLSKQYISDIENGRRNISLEVAKKLSTIFQKSIERFINTETCS